MRPLPRSEALGWLRERGIDAEATASFRLVAEETELPGAVVRRLWHSSATLRLPAVAEPGAILLLAPLDGAFSLATGSGEPRVVSGDRCAVVPEGRRATLETTAPSARLELIARPAGPAGAAVPSLVAAPVARTALIAAANAILDAHAPRADASGRSLGAALQDLLSAVLAGAAVA